MYLFSCNFLIKRKIRVDFYHPPRYNKGKEKHTHKLLRFFLFKKYCFYKTLHPIPFVKKEAYKKSPFLKLFLNINIVGAIVIIYRCMFFRGLSLYHKQFFK